MVRVYENGTTGIYVSTDAAFAPDKDIEHAMEDALRSACGNVQSRNGCATT